MLQEKLITIEEGRDMGKTFLVKEMPVSRVEKWSCRALCALFGAELPADIANASKTSSTAAIGMAVVKGLAAIDWEKAEPLYDELLAQIYRVPKPEQPTTLIQLCAANLDAHIEDAKTIFKLRWEAASISLGFLLGGEDLTSRLGQKIDQMASAIHIHTSQTA